MVCFNPSEKIWIPNWESFFPRYVGAGWTFKKNALSCPPARITSWSLNHLQHLEIFRPPNSHASSSFGAKGASGAAGASHIPYRRPGRWDTDGRFFAGKDDGSPSRAFFPKKCWEFLELPMWVGRMFVQKKRLSQQKTEICDCENT